MNKRALIVGYFVVDQNMGGVRLRRIARLLPRHGWNPVVLTHPPGQGSPPVTGDVRLETVHSLDLTRFYAKIRRAKETPLAAPDSRSEPKVISTRITGRFNRWLMVPDKHLTWYRSALQRGRELLQREKFDVIFASLEPRTASLVAAQLSRETGVPFVLEYRDLWTGSPYHALALPTVFHRWLHERLERRTVQQARAVSAVCRGIADYLGQKYASELQVPVAVNYNFFDPEEYPPSTLVASATPRPLVVSYVGAMYASRTPHQFFEGMRAYLDRAKLTPLQFRFCWAGNITDVDDLGKVIDRTGVRPYMEFLGQIPHQDALQLLIRSDAALLIQAAHDAIHIPGKLFEAMGARVPLLALANPCEVTDIIQRCRAGIVCPYTAESVAAALEEFHRLSTQGTRWQFNEVEVQKFSADASVAQLAALFDRATQ